MSPKLHLEHLLEILQNVHALKPHVEHILYSITNRPQLLQLFAIAELFLSWYKKISQEMLFFLHKHLNSLIVGFGVWV